MKSPRLARLERGFGAVAAIVVVVVLAALAAAVVKLSWTQQGTGTQDLLATRALQAANAGSEWGLYQALKNSSCASGGTTLDLRSDTGFYVTVTCSADSYNEGESSTGAPVVIKTYTITAVACNGSGTCPDNTAATTPTYVERSRQVTATNN
jgi:MSHA biogenesis protein MshP